MIDRAQVERAAELFRAPDGSFERLLRRRDRKRRNQRIGAGALAIIIALVSFVALTRAFSASKRPADEPVPKPRGIFSGVGGWIVYGDEDGIWAVDPTRPDDPNSQIQLSTDRGTPLDWSSDGSKLLILSYKPLRSPMPLRLFVLNADGSETTLATSRKWSSEGSSYWSSGGSFSPDGSQVVYAAPPQGTWRSAIYVVDTQGGTPRVLLSGGRRLYPAIGRSIRSWLSNPTYSPDGTQIAYFDHQLDGPSQLRVMNADGTGVRVLLDGTGYHSYTLAWSPDGERLAWADEDLIPEHQTDRSPGIFVVGADGSGLTLAIPGGADPYWSPDGTRLAYRIGAPEHCRGCSIGTLEIAALDGTHLQEFGSAEPGPWNPLVQPEPEVAEVPAASEGLTLTSGLLAVAVLLAVIAGAALIRRRTRRNAGTAI